MPGCQRVRPDLPGRREQVVELDVLIAGDAGHGGLARHIGVGKAVDHLGAEAALVVEHVMGDAEARRDSAGVVDILPRAAGALAPGGGAVVVELQRHPDDVISLALEQSGHDREVHTAGHGYHDARLPDGLGEIQGVELG